MAQRQLPLFGNGTAPRIDPAFRALERIELERGAWLEIGRGWLRGDAALFKLLARRVAWQTERRVMYERTVDVRAATRGLAESS